MKSDPEETILLTQEEYERMLEICNEPVELTEHMLTAIKRYKKRTNETKTQGAKGT